MRKEKWIAVLGAALLAAVVLLVFLFPPWDRPTPEKSQMEASTGAAGGTGEPAPTLPPPAPNPYGPEDFQQDGPYLICTAGEYALGIDVSEHQQAVDWAAVKDAGIEFVMIRLGYRGYKTGNLTLDVKAQEFYTGARQAGLKVGAYFYSQAVSPQEAREEAAFALDAAADWEMELPLVYDWEYVSESARTGAMDRRTLTDCSKAFCDEIQAAGRMPMLYFNRDQASQLLILEELTDYPFWLAMYSGQMNYPYRLGMWQYSNTGQIPGIEGNVDLDLYFVDP